MFIILIIIFNMVFIQSSYAMQQNSVTFLPDNTITSWAVRSDGSIATLNQQGNLVIWNQDAQKINEKQQLDAESLSFDNDKLLIQNCDSIKIYDQELKEIDHIKLDKKLENPYLIAAKLSKKFLIFLSPNQHQYKEYNWDIYITDLSGKVKHNYSMGIVPSWSCTIDSNDYIINTNLIKDPTDNKTKLYIANKDGELKNTIQVGSFSGTLLNVDAQDNIIQLADDKFLLYMRNNWELKTISTDLKYGYPGAFDIDNTHNRIVYLSKKYPPTQNIEIPVRFKDLYKSIQPITGYVPSKKISCTAQSSHTFLNYQGISDTTHGSVAIPDFSDRATEEIKYDATHDSVLFFHPDQVGIVKRFCEQMK